MSAAVTLSPNSGLHYLPSPFELSHGDTLSNGQLAFEFYGPEDAPVVLVQGGISAGRRTVTVDTEKGWWDSFVGLGKPIDLDRFRVLSVDYLGGQGGSTGPANTVGNSPFPTIGSHDQARAVKDLLDNLGIDQVHAFVGASYGGMVALSFGALFPRCTPSLVIISAADGPHPLATGWRSLQRKIVRLGVAQGAPAEGLALARGLAMTTYRTAEEFAERFDGPASVSEDGVTFPIDAYLEHHGARFSETFVPESFLCLSESIDLHHIDPARIEAKTTLISVDSDTLVPSWQSRRLAKSLTCPTHFHEVSSLYGHDAFLKEVDSIGGIIHNALLSTPEEGGQHVTA